MANETSEHRPMHVGACSSDDAHDGHDWNVSDAPSVSTSGQVIWSVRDLLFSEGRERAAAALRNVQVLEEE